MRKLIDKPILSVFFYFFYSQPIKCCSIRTIFLKVSTYGCSLLLTLEMIFEVIFVGERSSIHLQFIFQLFISKMNIHLKFVLNCCIIHVDQMGKFVNSLETSIAASKLTMPIYLSLSLYFFSIGSKCFHLSFRLWMEFRRNYCSQFWWLRIFHK